MELIITILIAALLAASFLINTIVKSLKPRNIELKDNTTIFQVLRQKKFILFSTIGGTLTSLASVYLFFLLQTPAYGWLILLSLIGLPLGAFVAKNLSERALHRASYEDEFKKAITNGVMASLHICCSKKGTAEICRKISIVNILAVIWLETKILTSITLSVLLPEFASESIVIALLASTIIFFLTQYITRFGMNGVIITDVLYWPLIIISVLLVILVTTNSFSQSAFELQLQNVLPLEMSIPSMLAFSLNVLLINSIYQISREDHWIRVSAFRSDNDIKDNPAVNSLVLVAMLAIPIWLCLIFAGFLYGVLLGEEELTLNSIVQFHESVVMFLPILILGMFASMMSTTDNQLFAVRRLVSLDIRNNRITDKNVNKFDSVIYSLGLAAIFFTTVYYANEFKLNDTNLVFTCLGLPAVLFPSLLVILYGRVGQKSHVYVPLIIYVAANITAYIYKDPVLILLVPPATLILGCLYALVFSSPSESLSEGKV